LGLENIGIPKVKQYPAMDTNTPQSITESEKINNNQISKPESEPQ
jgi:hypothetical protein